MASEIVPVACPRCGERQNQIKGQPGAGRLLTGPVTCMVCQHTFSDAEYQAGLDVARQEIAERLASRGGARA